MLSKQIISVFTVVALICIFGPIRINASSGYEYYPFVPTGLYQTGMNVSFVSGRFSFFQEIAGYGSGGSYNGVIGITFDQTEKFGFLTTSDGKILRKLNLRTTLVTADITGKLLSILLYLIVYQLGL